jgi:hypothetical protein
MLVLDRVDWPPIQFSVRTATVALLRHFHLDPRESFPRVSDPYCSILPLKNPSFEGLLFEERLFYERRLALRGAAWPIHRAVSHCGRIAGGLEERGIPAPRGGNWSAVQVARLLKAAAVPFDASAGAAEETSNAVRLVRVLPNRSDIRLAT